MVKVITTRDAVVRTATIEIKALTLNGKQLTLSAFRQIQRETLLDPHTLTLSGVPWGRVNYHPDDCKDEMNHLHVVWQKGDELRRSAVYRHHIQFATHEIALRMGNVGIGLAAMYAHGEEPKIKGHWISQVSDSFIAHAKLEFSNGRSILVPGETPSGRKVVQSLKRAWCSGYSVRGIQKPYLEDPGFLDFAREALALLQDEGASESGQALQVLARLTRERESIEKRWNEQVDALEALDQLFIAV